MYFAISPSRHLAISLYSHSLALYSLSLALCSLLLLGRSRALSLCAYGYGCARAGDLVKLSRTGTQYKLHGEPSETKPMVVCIHGINTAHYQFDQLATDLALSG